MQGDVAAVAARARACVHPRTPGRLTTASAGPAALPKLRIGWRRVVSVSSSAGMVFPKSFRVKIRHLRCCSSTYYRFRYQRKALGPRPPHVSTQRACSRDIRRVRKIRPAAANFLNGTVSAGSYPLSRPRHLLRFARDGAMDIICSTQHQSLFRLIWKIN